MFYRYFSLAIIFGMAASVASFADETFVHPLMKADGLGYPGTNTQPAWTFRPEMRPILATDRNAKFFCRNKGYSDYDASGFEKEMFYAVGGSGSPVVYDIEAAPAFENLSNQDRADVFSEAREQALLQGRPYQETDAHMSYSGEIISKISCINTK